MNRHETRRAATPLELLFDLTFVVAVVQAATQLEHLSGWRCRGRRSVQLRVATTGRWGDRPATPTRSAWHRRLLPSLRLYGVLVRFRLFRSRRPRYRGIVPLLAPGVKMSRREYEEWRDANTWDPARETDLVVQSDLAPAGWIEPLIVPDSFEVRLTEYVRRMSHNPSDNTPATTIRLVRRSYRAFITAGRSRYIHERATPR